MYAHKSPIISREPCATYTYHLSYMPCSMHIYIYMYTQTILYASTSNIYIHIRKHMWYELWIQVYTFAIYTVRHIHMHISSNIYHMCLTSYTWHITRTPIYIYTIHHKQPIIHHRYHTSYIYNKPPHTTCIISTNIYIIQHMYHMS